MLPRQPQLPLHSEKVEVEWEKDMKNWGRGREMSKNQKSEGRGREMIKLWEKWGRWYRDEEDMRNVRVKVERWVRIKKWEQQQRDESWVRYEKSEEKWR